MYLLNIFSAGALAFVPFILLAAAIGFFISGYKSSRSGSVTGGNEGTEIVKSAINVPIYKTWQFKFACVFLAAAIFALFSIAADYKGA